MADGNDLNDRELLIRVDERLGTVVNGQAGVKKEIRQMRDEQHETALAHAECAVLQNTRWAAHDKEHDGMEKDIRRKSNIGDALALGVAAVAAALNINWKSG